MVEDQSYSFRTAFNGFRREDVVSYVYRLNQKYESQLAEKEETIRRLTQENRRLQTAAKTQEAPRVESAELGMAQKELEAYRRAEQFERETRQWSERVYNELLDSLQVSGNSVEQLQAQLQSLAQSLAEQTAQVEALTRALEAKKEAAHSRGVSR